MRLSVKVLSILLFIAIAVISAVLLVFPVYIYRILLFFIELFQSGGLIFFFIAMIVQALALPIPSEFILMCGGAAFGFLQACVVGLTGSVVASAICFYISRIGGRPLALKLVGERGVEFADNWFNRWGKWAVLLGRMAPVIPFDPISYGAGLTSMKFKDFVVPTSIGMLPRAFFYVLLGSYFGGTLSDLMQYYSLHHEFPPEYASTILTFNLILLAIVISMGTILLVYWILMKRYQNHTVHE